MSSTAIPTRAVPYTRHIREGVEAPDVPVDELGRPAGGVRLRNVDTGEVITRHAVDAAGMVASGEYEAA